MSISIPSKAFLSAWIDFKKAEMREQVRLFHLERQPSKYAQFWELYFKNHYASILSIKPTCTQVDKSEKSNKESPSLNSKILELFCEFNSALSVLKAKRIATQVLYLGPCLHGNPIPVHGHKSGSSSSSLSSASSSTSSSQIEVIPKTLALEDEREMQPETGPGVLLHRAEELLHFLPVVLDTNRCEEAAYALRTAFKDKKVFAVFNFWIDEEYEMTIGSLVYFHLYLIQYLEKRESIRKDDPHYIKKAFLNQEGYQSTAYQRRLALERTCVELAIASLEDVINRYAKQSIEPLSEKFDDLCLNLTDQQIKTLPEAEKSHEAFIKNIQDHVTFLDSIKMRVNRKAIGAQYLCEVHRQPTQRARSKIVSDLRQHQGALYPIIVDLISKWKYDTLKTI